MTALAALGVGPGGEGIVPAYTWVAMINAVVTLGAVPVFVDIDDTLTIDPTELTTTTLRCCSRAGGDRPVAPTTCGHASWAAPLERVELYGNHALLMPEDLDRVRHV